MLYRQLKLVLDGAEEQLTSIVSQTKNNPLVYLSVQDILDAFTSQLCDVRPPLIKGNIDCSVENMGGMYSGSIRLPNESANNAWTNRNTIVQS
jgi:hypothetical protein